MEEAWGGEVPDVTREAYDAVVKAIDDWAAEAHAEPKAEDVGAERIAIRNAVSETVKPAEDEEQPKAENAVTVETGRASKGNPAIVEQLKADLQRRQQQMLDMVRDMLGKQGKQVSGDGIWRTLASGNFQVDVATKSQAQKNIAEDGY